MFFIKNVAHFLKTHIAMKKAKVTRMKTKKLLKDYKKNYKFNRK